MRACLWMAGLALAASNCATAPQQGGLGDAGPSASPTRALQAAVDAATPTGRLITVVETRDERISIHSSASGPKYTVATRGGRLVARGLSLDELAIDHREIHDLLRGAHAHKAQGPYLDAAVYPRDTRREAHPAEPQTPSR